MLNVLYVEVIAQWALRFENRFLFPNIELDKILEMDFKIKRFLHIDYDYKNFSEFKWMYEKIIQLSQANKQDGGNNFLSQLLGL